MGAAEIEQSYIAISRCTATGRSRPKEVTEAVTGSDQAQCNSILTYQKQALSGRGAAGSIGKYLVGDCSCIQRVYSEQKSCIYIR